METPFRASRKAAVHTFCQLAQLLRLRKKKRRIPQLNGDVLERIFRHLDLKQRTQLREVSQQFCNVVERMPVHVPFLMLHSKEDGVFELLSDQLEFVAGHLLSEMSARFVKSSDHLAMSEAAARAALRLIASKVHCIEHLWLDTRSNSHLIEAIVNAASEDPKQSPKLKIAKITIIGCADVLNVDLFRRLLLASHYTMTAIRLRHIRILSQVEAENFWHAIGRCERLSALQYEPCKPDFFSRSACVDVLKRQKLRHLTLTGIPDLTAQDVCSITKRGSIKDLCVISHSIRPSDIAYAPMVPVLASLDTLTIQIDENFNLADELEKRSLVSIAQTLPEHALLEVVHVLTPGSPPTGYSTVTRVIAYWIDVATKASRSVKLKLDDVPQERLDAATGRILRKLPEISRGEWFADGVVLSGGAGRLIVLDKSTWFGDEDTSF